MSKINSFQDTIKAYLREMEPRGMSTEHLRLAVLRCESRLAWQEYGLMQTEHRVREAMREYQAELEKRKQIELDFK